MESPKLKRGKCPSYASALAYIQPPSTPKSSSGAGVGSTHRPQFAKKFRVTTRNTQPDDGMQLITVQPPPIPPSSSYYPTKGDNTSDQQKSTKMEPESDGGNATETSVRDLQQVLFPISPRKSNSDTLLSSWFLKSPATLTENLSGHSLYNRESRENFIKDTNCTNQQPRWPTECQVLETRVMHIPTAPSSPEPYYAPNGREVQPKPVGDECGIVVYQYYPMSAVNYFSRSSLGGSKYLLPTCPAPEEESLRFESRFESGNLAKVIKITSVYYELYLRADLYTNRHMQWFYFRITNMKKNIHYRFSIVNLMKGDSLFNEGMKPLMYSEKDSQLHSIGWRRCGDNITYYCNDNANPDDPDQIMFNTLSFTVDFPHDDDTIYIAHSYPYTYSDLQDYLHETSVHPLKSAYTNLRLLCKTLAGNNVYYITVTSPQTSQTDNKRKRAIVITARVHPGETPASWMMKGVLDFITSDSAPARELRDRFIFKIVPMLNPDGVIVGNNRCSLTARDLNRQYRTVIRESYPSIYYTKLMIRRLLDDCGVALYCDLHAHSRKHNIFIYGCENRRNAEKRLQEQVFPLMLHKNAADKFSFENCVFRIQRNKEGTGRVVMWMMGIANSYTMEASFGGSSLGSRTDTHFTTVDYEQMGKAFCQTLLDFYDEDPRKEKLRSKIIMRLVKEGSNADEPTNIPLSDYSSDNGDTSSASSDDECGRDLDARLLAPPPSPSLSIYQHRPNVRRRQVRSRTKNRSTLDFRKPLAMCRATLGLGSKNQAPLNRYESSSDTETELAVRDKALATRKKKFRKRSGIKKPKEFGDRLSNMKKPNRELTVVDLGADTKVTKTKNIIQKSITSHNRISADNGKKNISQQLNEVQARLSTLKNKLWFGTGDASRNLPLSWGPTKLNASHSAPPAVNTSDERAKKNKKSKSDKKTCITKVTVKKVKTKEGGEPAKIKPKKNGQTKKITLRCLPSPIRAPLKREQWAIAGRSSEKAVGSFDSSRSATCFLWKCFDKPEPSRIVLRPRRRISHHTHHSYRRSIQHIDVVAKAKKKKRRSAKLKKKTARNKCPKSRKKSTFS